MGVYSGGRVERATHQKTAVIMIHGFPGANLRLAPSDPLLKSDEPASEEKKTGDCRSSQTTEQSSIMDVGVISYRSPLRTGPKIDEMPDYRVLDPRHRKYMPVRPWITGLI